MLRSFEETLIDRLKNAYLNKENVENLEGTIIVLMENIFKCRQLAYLN